MRDDSGEGKLWILMFKMKMVLSSRLNSVAKMVKMFKMYKILHFLTETFVMLPMLTCDYVAVVELAVTIFLL